MTSSCRSSRPTTKRRVVRDFRADRGIRAAQHAHLERLRAIERYPSLHIHEPGQSRRRQIFSGRFSISCAREALSAASIDEIKTAVRAKSLMLTDAQMDGSYSRFAICKSDPSFAHAIEEARKGNSRVAEGIWLQIYEN